MFDAGRQYYVNLAEAVVNVHLVTSPKKHLLFFHALYLVPRNKKRRMKGAKQEKHVEIYPGISEGDANDIVVSSEVIAEPDSRTSIYFSARRGWGRVTGGKGFPPRAGNNEGYHHPHADEEKKEEGEERPKRKLVGL